MRNLTVDLRGMVRIARLNYVKKADVIVCRFAKLKLVFSHKKNSEKSTTKLPKTHVFFTAVRHVGSTGESVHWNYATPSYVFLVLVQVQAQKKRVDLVHSKLCNFGACSSLRNLNALLLLNHFFTKIVYTNVKSFLLQFCSPINFLYITNFFFKSYHYTFSYLHFTHCWIHRLPFSSPRFMSSTIIHLQLNRSAFWIIRGSDIQVHSVNQGKRMVAR